MDTRCADYVATRGLAFAAIALLLTACGGDGSKDEPAPAPFERPGPSATPTISWTGDLAEPQSRVVSLSVSTLITVAGLKQVDFFIDGILSQTMTAGSPQPGVPVVVYNAPWDTSSYSDGPHTVMARVTDNANLTAETSTRVITIENNISIPLSLSTGELFPTPASAATGSGQLAVNVATGAIGGDLLLTNMTADAVHIHSGWPTVTGPSLVDLVFDAATQRWIVPADTHLTSVGSFAQVNDLLAGAMYIDAHSTAHPDGELRAQILLKTISLAFGSLSGEQEVPPMSSAGRGMVSVLENRETQSFQINARTVGLDNVVSIGVYSKAGPASQTNWLYFLRPDPNGNLLAGGAISTPGYNNGTWYIQVTTAQHLSGEIGGLVPVIDH